MTEWTFLDAAFVLFTVLLGVRVLTLWLEPLVRRFTPKADTCPPHVWKWMEANEKLSTIAGLECQKCHQRPSGRQNGETWTTF